MVEGTIAARFELAERRGSGGMGQIYRAVDRVTGKSVALKVLRDEKVGDAARFEHEAQVLAELDHDAIVRYVAHGRAEQGWFLAMEWLEGEDLSERLHRAPLAPAEAVSMLARIADALAVAHARGVVHRDVKPSNIFLPDGDPSRAKLLDFGVARSTVASRPETVTGTALGTPGYMAPEQARGERDLDARVDVFAMGAVLFRCLAGTPPFDAANTVAVLSKVLFDEPPPLAEIRPDLPPEVHAAVALMLAKDRAVRPADGAALARMLWDLAPQVALAAPPSAAGAGITGGEDRIRSSVMVRRGGQVPRPVADTSGIIGGSTLPTVALVEDASTVAAMRLALSMRGAFEKLADGTWAIVFAGEGATEMATRACRFALALRERFPEARIAIATGRARAASTVTHGAFDRAGRLLSDLPPCTIVVDDVTASLVEARLAIERGPAGLVVVGEVGERATGRRVHGVVTPFVGRQKELRLLDGLFAGAVEDGRPAAALVVGTAGSGKSRLAAELIARIERDGAVVWRGDADPLASSAPFAPVARILRRALGAAGPRPAPISRETIELRVREVMAGDDATRVIAAVRSLLDVTTSAADDAVDPVARGDRIRRAVEDWIAAEARRQPLAIILDDVHWADPGTIALIDGVLRNVEGPVFVLALARPEVHDRFPRLWADRGVTTVQLAPLSSNAATQLARAALGVTAADELVATLAERSAGNPFFLEELVRARADRGTDEWPETVLATVEARLATLDGDARRLLRAAAVIGPVFWPGAVIHLVGGAPFASTVTSRLETLIAREFVIASPESRFVGERQLAFRHALVRDAAYDTLPEEDRELAHKLAAEWLERVGEAPAVIAEHLVRAGAAEAAVSHCVSAAEAALVGDDVAGALALCERGVAAGAAGERLGALRWLEAEACWWRGEHARAEMAGTVALGLLEPRSPRWYAALGATAWAAGAQGDADRLVELARELIKQPPHEAAVSHDVIASVKLVDYLLHAGEAVWFKKVVPRAQSLVQRLGPDDPAWGWVDYMKFRVARRDGDLGRATRHVEASMEGYARDGDLRNACLQRAYLGMCQLMLGALETAEATLRRALAEAARLGAAYPASQARLYLGRTLVLLGRRQEAMETLDVCRRELHDHGDVRGDAEASSYMAEAMGADRLAEALLVDALEHVEELPPLRARLTAQRARMCLARGEVAEALALAGAAHELIDAGAIVEEGEALIRLAYVEALAAAGRTRDAGDIAWVALQRLRTRARRLGDPAWEQSFLERVPENAATVAIAAQLGVSDS